MTYIPEVSNIINRLIRRFTTWPKDALERVALMFLKQTEMDESYTDNCVLICQYFHTTVQESAESFYKEQKRRVYVTPTSYLELLQTFKTLYYMKVEQITLQRDR